MTVPWRENRVLALKNYKLRFPCSFCTALSLSRGVYSQKKRTGVFRPGYGARRLLTVREAHRPSYYGSQPSIPFPSLGFFTAGCQNLSLRRTLTILSRVIKALQCGKSKNTDSIFSTEQSGCLDYPKCFLFLKRRNHQRNKYNKFQY